MHYFRQNERDGVTVEELLNEIDGTILFTNNITVLDDIVEMLNNDKRIDEETAVIF